MHVDFSLPSPEQNRLSECEEQAKAAKKGTWSEGNGSHTIRDLKYTIENPRHFVDSHHQKPVNGEAGWHRHVAVGCLCPCACERLGPGTSPAYLVSTGIVKCRPSAAIGG